ncbi:DUF4174 domain-containing protein [Litorisediminicola beolgyonensis]|uniref:DUF4174 domain-containing protein n=1 Tax=Litorisediminicola beolgyonensis TaxID=1173614 RepID=A0ABW3ZKR3_9RHOB
MPDLDLDDFLDRLSRRLHLREPTHFERVRESPYLPAAGAALAVGATVVVGLFLWRSFAHAEGSGRPITLIPERGSESLENDGVFADLDPETRSLVGLKWENRPVVIFAPSRAHPGYGKQRKILEEVRDGLIDRDIVVLSDTDPAQEGALRDRYGAHEFEVLLIGKDGAIKLRRTEPVSAQELFETIDAMPMRQREMKDG